MASYCTIRDAPLDQLLTWWDHPDLLVPEFSREELIEEVAQTLSKHGDTGVATLKRHLFDDDMDRRQSTLSALAWPQTDDAEIREALLTAFGCSVGSTRYAALWGFIQLGYFPLSEEDISRGLESDDGRMEALAMVYLSRAHEHKAMSLLKDGLLSSNPHKRSYACDEIGDRFIMDLADEMQALVHDSVAVVREAAQSNLEFFQ